MKQIDPIDYVLVVCILAAIAIAALNTYLGS